MIAIKLDFPSKFVFWGKLTEVPKFGENVFFAFPKNLVH